MSVIHLNDGGLEHAIALAAAYHRAQKDKGGQPYILHVIRVVVACEGYHAKCAAALHDLVEDTPMTLDGLVDHGFAPQVVAAVEALTHQSGESYDAYIARIAENAIATTVKIADLRDNLNRDRIPHPTMMDESRWAKYRAALIRLGATP